MAGVISIYLSLTLILTCALIMTLIESARVSYMNAKLQSVTYMAADSVFSGFAEPVFDRYGVMMLWSTEDEFLHALNDHCTDNLKTDALEGSIFTDIYKVSFDSSSLSSKVSPTDKGGQVFADQVLEYMKYFLPVDAAGRILGSVSIFDQGNKVSDFLDKIESYKDVFTKVEESVGDLKETIDTVRSKAGEPSRFLDQASSSIDRFKNGDASAQASFRNSISDLARSKEKLSNGLEKIQSSSDDYYKNVEKAKNAVTELENDLNVNRDDFDDEVYGIVSEQLEDIRQKSADTDFDYYLVGSNLDTTGYYLEKLDSIDELTEITKDPLTAENADYYETVIDEYRSDFSDFSLDALGVNLDSFEVEKEDSSFLTRISEIAENGLLGFIAGDVSDKKIETACLPSSTDSDGNPVEAGGDLLSATADKALFGEYILQHFGNCTDVSDDTALDYEAEYIINGKDSDKGNLSAAVSQIVLIRSGCNLISILKSPGKKAETYALATSLVGFTGMPVVIKVFQIVIMAAWALAESVADVKALIEGHKIKTIKDDSDWYLSLAGIKNFGSDALSPSGTESGLSYEAYLRLLLLMQNNKTQYFRTMDMIQADMCLSENEDFRISSCLTGVTVDAAYSAPQLFINFPFVRNVVGYSEDGYIYSMTQEYSY